MSMERRTIFRRLVALSLVACSFSAVAREEARVRARDLGVAPGIFAPGTHNAITDVAGVRVGQVTLTEGDNIRTGVTAILPHPGNVYRSRVATVSASSSAARRSTSWANWKRRSC